MKILLVKRQGTGITLSAFLSFILSISIYGEQSAYVIEISEHRFKPDKITIPANQRVKLIVKNTDASAEEFESYDLNREKIVPAKSEVSVFVGPLKPGAYRFFGEFHQETAQGIITVLPVQDSGKSFQGE